MVRVSWRVALRLCGFVALAATAAAYAQFDPDTVYREAAAVLAHYPDPAVSYTTPAFRPGRQDFTSHAEMMEFLQALEARAGNMQLTSVGHSQEGRSIPLVVLTGSGLSNAADLAGLGRPIVMLVGLQHGNEPAGGEAMLVLAQALAAGPMKALLGRLTVLIVPRANPDGAHYFRREPYGTVDVNRDHVKLDLPETAALHAVLNEYRPHVVVDAHEFSVAGRWLKKFDRLQSYDVLLQPATNPAVPQRITGLANTLYLPAVRRELDAAGYTHHRYFTTSYDIADKRVYMGGVSPNIGRNFAGLEQALSFLVETRGVGIGRQSYARRVASHVAAIGAILRTTAENAAAVMSAVQASRLDVVQRGRHPSSDDRIAVTVRQARSTHALEFRNAQSGEIERIDVDWSDARSLEPDLERTRPYAYLMPPAYGEIAERLARSGVNVRRLRTPATLEVEQYEVLERRVSRTYIQGRAVTRVTTEVSPQRMTFAPGSYVYTMAQPNAEVIAAALEPEAVSSFVSFGLIPVDARSAPATIAAPSIVPVYRLLAPQPLDAALVDPLR
jgi:hypothetical protein